MKTWVREDGKHVSTKPDRYVIGKDHIGNNIFNDSEVVLYQKWDRKLRFGLIGSTVSSLFDNSKYDILLLEKLEPTLDMIDTGSLYYDNFIDYETRVNDFDSTGYEYVGSTIGSNQWECIYKDKHNMYIRVNIGDKMGGGFDYIYPISKKKAKELIGEET